MFLDSHVHFDMLLENNPGFEKELIKNLKYSGIEFSVQVSIDSEGLEWSRDFSKRNYKDGIYYTAGIHPSSHAGENELQILGNFTEKEKSARHGNLLFGIGECGLDYYRMHQPKEMQISSFEFQIELAQKHKLPLIVHLRDALQDGYDILKKKKAVHGIMHCFSGDSAAAKKFLDMGFMISFAGNVTYKTAADLHNAAKYVPLDMILLETDAPFLSPIPLRGKPNSPENIKHTYRFISDLKQISSGKLEDAVAGNFLKLVKK